MFNNLLWRNSDLLNVLDLSFWRFRLEEISLGLASCYLVDLVVDFMIIICGQGEAVSCTNNHTLGDDGTTAYLCVVLVDAHVPRN